MSSVPFFVGLPENGPNFVTKIADAESHQAEVEVEAIYVNQEGIDSETGVPNAPRGRISEIFSGDEADGRVMNGSGPARSGRLPRTPRDTPTRPRDTHSRLFGQGVSAPPPAPQITDTVRSNIRFGDADTNGHNGHNGHSSKSASINGSGSNTPSRDGNPITGDGYKSLNGEINTAVTALNGNYMPINHNRIPPGGYSSGLW